MRTYSHSSANEVWKSVAGDLLGEIKLPEVGSRCGDTREILHAVLEVQDPRQRWVVARSPPINPAFALAEVVWILTGRSDTSLLAHWFPKYPSYVGGGTRQHAPYGNRLRRHFGFDQLVRGFEALRANPESRQVVLQIWSADDDMPMPDGEPRTGDIPCNIGSSLRIQDGRLHWLQFLRSNDIDRGLPHNLVQFTTLQEIMTGWLGLEIGSYVQVISSLHFYCAGSSRLAIDRNVEGCPNSDRFDHAFDESLYCFNELGTLMDQIRQRRHEQQDTRDLVVGKALPEAFMNIFRIVAADDARRYGDADHSTSLMQECSNPAYHQLWTRWEEHVNSRWVAHPRRNRRRTMANPNLLPGPRT